MDDLNPGEVVETSQTTVSVNSISSSSTTTSSTTDEIRCQFEDIKESFESLRYGTFIKHSAFYADLTITKISE